MDDQIWQYLIIHEFVESYPSNSNGVGGLDKKKSSKTSVSEATLLGFSRGATLEKLLLKLLVFEFLFCPPTTNY